MLDQRAREAVDVLQGERQAADTFNELFLVAVPPGQIAALARQLEADNGKIVAVEDIREKGSGSATFRIRFERATATAHLTIEAKAPFKVSGFRIEATTPLDDSPTKVATAFAALPGRSGFAIFKLGEGAPAQVAASHDDEVFAVGSAFKLWVLDALAEDVAAGRHRWDEVVRIGPRSLPSGITQDWPPQAPVTVETLATLMISMSDNTATDTLIHLVGRDRVAERVRATGHSSPERMLPFLTTAEAFALKLSPPELRDAYARADDGQARMLAELDTAKTLAGLDLEANGDDRPIAIDSLEWFASPGDIARVLDALRRRADPRVLQILSVAPSMTREWREGFTYLGYKGGSEVGVAHLSWLLRKPSGEWLVVTASWNDPKAPVDNDRLKLLGKRLVALARQGS